MQRTSLVVRSLLLGALFLSFACGDLERSSPYDRLSPADKQAKARVTGTVALSGETDHQGVAIELQSPDRTYAVESRPNGAFEIAGIVPGTYDLHVNARYFSGVSERLQVDLGQAVNLKTLSLEPLEALVSGSALAKKIVGSETVEQGGVFLKLTKQSSIRSPSAASRYSTAGTSSANPIEITVVSQPDGSYTMSGVPAGVYLLVAIGEDGATEEVGGVRVTGEEERVVVDDIVLEPLTGFVDIIGTSGGFDNENLTSTPLVTLRTVAIGAQTMTLGMSASGTAAGCGFDPAVPYAAEVTNFVLTGMNGVNTVCVRYIAADGRKTVALTDDILLDTAAPTGGSVEVLGAERDGIRYVTETGGSVDVRLSAFDLYTRLTGLKIANSAGDCAVDLAGATEEGFTTLKSWVLAGPVGNGIEGDRTVCAAFKDEAGNWSNPVSHTVVYDTLAPTVTGNGIAINGVDSWTTSIQVTLTLSASGASEMMLANGASFGAAQWEPFRPQKAWTLENTEGTREVSVKFRDAAGNETTVFADQIEFDQTGPEAPVLSLSDIDADGFALSSTAVELRWTKPSAADLAGFKLERYIEGVNTDFDQIAELGAEASSYKDYFPGTTGYTHHYRIRAFDVVGNQSSFSSVIAAKPFAPITRLRQLRGLGEARYFMAPERGTFLVSTDWKYDKPFPGISYRDQLGFNVLQWTWDIALGRFNDSFVVRTSNVDNTLVYETVFDPLHDQRGFDGEGLVGNRPSIGAGADGRVQLAYSNSGIFYASNENGAWETDARYPTISVGTPNAAFSPSGDAVIAFLYAMAMSPPQLDVRINGIWTSAESSGDATIYNPSQLRVAMDTLGNAYLVYGAGTDGANGFAAQQGVRIIRRAADGTWGTYTEFDGTQGAVSHLSVARGKNRTCFAYKLNGSGALRYGCRYDGGSTTGPVTVPASPTTAKATAIAVNDWGISIAYVDGNDDLHLWEQISGSTITLHTDAATPAMAAGPDQTVHLVFRSLSSIDLVYYHNASLTWAGRTLAADGGQGYAPSVAVGVDGRVHIAYKDNLNGQLGYINLEQPIARNIGARSETLASARASDGKIHIVMRYPIDDTLYHGIIDGHTINYYSVDANVTLTQGVSLTLDALDKAHIVYNNAGDTAVRYATNASGPWVAEEISGTGAFSTPSLALQGGFVHVLADNRYVRGTGGGLWLEESIPGQPGGVGDIAVASDGTVHVAAYPAMLIDIGSLVHQYGTFGSWSSGYSDIGWYGAPRLKIGPDDKLHIAVEISGDLVLISEDGAGYTRRSVETQNNSGRGVDFVFDDEGKMHFVFADQTNGTLRYATDALTGSFQSIEIAETNTLDQNAIALDADGNPIIVFNNGRIVIVEDFNRRLTATTVSRTTAY